MSRYLSFLMNKWFLLLSILAANRLIAQTPVSTGTETLWCGDAGIIFYTSCTAEQPGLRFIHVHENEKTAVQAAMQMLTKYGKGCFTTWQCQNERYISFKLNGGHFKFDPNRIYTSKGRRETLDSNGDYSKLADEQVEAVANTFLTNYIDSQQLVIALHNNTDDSNLTINGYKKGGPFAKDAKKVHVSHARDEDDFFLTTDIRIYHYISKKGFNILLQDNEHVADDGSLSVYAAIKKIPYLNIEAQHGHLQQQLEMIDVVEEMIAALFPATE